MLSHQRPGYNAIYVVSICCDGLPKPCSGTSLPNGNLVKTKQTKSQKGKSQRKRKQGADTSHLAFDRP